MFNSRILAVQVNGTKFINGRGIQLGDKLFYNEDGYMQVRMRGGKEWKFCGRVFSRPTDQNVVKFALIEGI